MTKIEVKKQVGFAVVAALFAVLLAFSAVADSGTAGLSGKGEVNAGITPDSPLHVFDRIFDSIGLALAFGSENKAGKALDIANERLAETEEMIARNRLDAAGAAQAGHGNALEVARRSVSGFRGSDNADLLEKQVKFEAELEKHEVRIGQVRDGLKVKLELEDGISESQLSFIDSLMSLLQNQTGKVKAEIDGEKGKLKLKIKSEEGKSEVEFETEIRGLEERTGLAELRRDKAREQIDEAVEELAEARDLVSGSNLTNVTGGAAVAGLIAQADLKIAGARAAFNESKFGEAFGLAEAAEHLAKNAKRQLERSIAAGSAGRNGGSGEERLEIKAEINSTAEAKVELRFTSASTNRTEIINELLSRLNLTREDIDRLLDLENESAADMDFNDRLKTEIRIKDGLAGVRFELEFPLNTTNRSEIVDGIFSRLSSLTAEGLEKALGAEQRVDAGRDDEREIEIEVEDGTAKVKVEVGRERLRFNMPFTTEAAVFSEVSSRTGIPLADVMSLAEVKIENGNGDSGRGVSGEDDDKDEDSGRERKRGRG